VSEVIEKPSVLLVIGNLASESSTAKVASRVGALLQEQGCQVDTFDAATEALPLFNVQTAFSSESYPALKQRVSAADVLVMATPDYHGSMSSATKNFLDHFWKEYAGKLFASIVGSYEKGLTVHDQLRTVARQCYAWSLPYGVSFHEKADLTEDGIGEDLEKRLRMLAGDIVRYGALLASQRKSDLNSEVEGFLAHYRSK
jgi:azobenzene reductase